MTSTALELSAPRIAGLVPARLLRGLATDIENLRAQLGLQQGQLKPSHDGAWFGELECPAGMWRAWPSSGAAAWIGRRQNQLPRVDTDMRTEPLDLIEGVRRLHARGLWCLELRLLTDEGWGPSAQASKGLAHLMALGTGAIGLSAVWSGGEYGPTRVELYRDGTIWASNWLDAERWLLTAAGVADV